MGLERYQRLPRTIVWTLGIMVLAAVVYVEMNQLLVERARRQTMLANSVALLERLNQLALGTAEARTDLAVLCDDLEQNARAEEEAGNGEAAESYRRQARKKREELHRMKRDEALLEEWSRYYSGMIRRYERAVRLPLSRLPPDPSPPDFWWEGGHPLRGNRHLSA